MQMLVCIIALVATLAVALTGCAPTSSSESERHPTPTAPAETQVVLSSLATPPAMPATDCSHLPLGGFGDVWRNGQVRPRLGCAVAPAEAVTGTEAYLCCMHAIGCARCVCLSP